MTALSSCTKKAPHLGRVHYTLIMLEVAGFAVTPPMTSR